MQTYISILRGINVSGHRQIKMEALKALYAACGYTSIVTYIQSGNVIFKAAEKVSGEEAAAAIEQAINHSFGFEVPVIVRTLEEMEQVIASNPFIAQKDIDTEKLHVTFLKQAPAPQNIHKLAGIDYAPDVFTFTETGIYLYCPGGYGNTKLSNTFFENKLKVTATTRNWKTVNKLVGLAKG